MKQPLQGLAQVEEAMANIEELADKEGVERIKNEYEKGDVIEIKNVSDEDWEDEEEEEDDDEAEDKKEDEDEEEEEDSF